MAPSPHRLPAVAGVRARGGVSPAAAPSLLYSSSSPSPSHPHIPVASSGGSCSARGLYAAGAIACFRLPSASASSATRQHVSGRRLVVHPRLLAKISENPVPWSEGHRIRRKSIWIPHAPRATGSSSARILKHFRPPGYRPSQNGKN
ncbi:hypothetical protein BRADI_5g19373v3 [Brachypodium distachyon]|uniref:Uncharacterized protein n=1 Tax=Brachypodium distachyon TaxID=15368 RepID=A0A0Q3E8J9_BRADI|nr:hypothetical protein BRADI_5g19373v3 [Brachypodium distachyon]